MAVSKSVQDKQTDITLVAAYNQTKKLVGKLSKTDFSDILNKKKQNISRRMSYDGFLLIDEASLLLEYLSNDGKTENDFYNDLLKVSKSSININKFNEIKSDDIKADDDFAELNVRGDVELSCGYGTVVYSDSVTGKCKVHRQTLREYGVNVSSIEVVYALGDSMSPEIKSGDALMVDTSQIELIDGVVYAFNYDGQPMCKRLQRIGKEIKAISTNPLFDPFFIDYNCQFNIVGRVVGIMRPVL